MRRFLKNGDRLGKVALATLFFCAGLFADMAVTQKATLNQNLYPDKTFDEVKELLVRKAKRKATAKIYGEYVISDTHLQSGKIDDEQTNDIVRGIIHLKGEPRFANGRKFGQIEVEITAYATTDEIKEHQSFMATQTGKASSTPTGFTTYKKPDSKKHQGFYGTWSGYVMSRLSGTTKAVVTISHSGQSKLSFPTLHCKSDLVIKSKDTSYVVFKQFLLYGSSRCMDKTKVMLERKDENEINFEQIDQNGEQISHGVLYLEE